MRISASSCLWMVLLAAAAGCQKGGTGPTPAGQPMLTGPDGSRPFKEWPVAAATLRGATLTGTTYPRLKWEFSADGRFVLTNGGEPFPDQLTRGDPTMSYGVAFLSNSEFARARKVEGTWGLKQESGTGTNSLTVSLEMADGRRTSTGRTVWLYPYHSSPRVVHLCYDTGGNGLVYILTPAEGQGLPDPPR